jgi:very-short-patch-repair endonuclease
VTVEDGKMPVPYDLWEKLLPLAREMRIHPTPAEDALWQHLRRKQINGMRFRRQYPIGQFIVDFYCPEQRLVIEVDGDIHLYTVEEDALRQDFIECLGYHVLRFTNEQVFHHLPDVLKQIAAGKNP